jgi:hypothetical protein
MADDSAPAGPPRQIRVFHRNGRLYAYDVSPNPGFREYFPLPRLPLSLVHWCQALCRLHLSRRRSRLIVLLLLDRHTGRWQPMVPTQSGSWRSARLSIRPSDFDPVAPTLLIAGSFQTAGGSGLVTAHGLVPPFDGLHVVHDRCSTWIFIRRSGEAALADPSSITLDDLRQCLDDAVNRLLVD